MALLPLFPAYEAGGAISPAADPHQVPCQTAIAEAHLGLRIGVRIGIDEAGRGCLAGPVVAAAVLFPQGFDAASALPGLDDSKKLTAARREALAVKVREVCIAHGVGLSWQEEIDRVNIRNATFRAMARAVLGLAALLEDMGSTAKERAGVPDDTLPLLLIDGNAVIPALHWQACCEGTPDGMGVGDASFDATCDGPAGAAEGMRGGAMYWERFLPPLPVRRPLRVPAMPEQRAVVDGDALVPSISAASVIAKTVRDSLMVRLDACCPGYGLARHKGYGTREHLRALAEKGPSALHRRTFRGVRREEEQLTLLQG